MNTTQLRYLVEYVSSGSVQKTADLLNVSRSSITRNIRQLEEELDTRLFINTPNGVAPTHTGEVCLRYAKEILRTEEDLFFDISEQGAYSRVINIGIGTSRSQRVLPAILPDFCRRYPHVSVQLHEKHQRHKSTAKAGHDPEGPIARQILAEQSLIKERCP